MLKKLSAWVLLFGIVTPLSAAADDSLVKFKGGIGVIPVSAGVAVAPTLATAQTVESVNRNIVRGVQPPGQLWTIADLRADVKADGGIKVRGRGLLLAGGNGIGAHALARIAADAESRAANAGRGARFSSHAAPFSTRCGRSRTWCGRSCGRLASGSARRPEPPLPIASANALAATRR